MAHSMDHLVAVEVTADPPLAIVSVVGYHDEEEAQFGGDGRPKFDASGAPVVKTVRVAETVDCFKGETAYLDPAETNISVLVRARLVKVLPKTAPKKAAKDA